MAKKDTVKNYTKLGIVATLVLAVAVGGVFLLRGFNGRSLDSALEGVSENAVSAADVKIAILRMDAIQQQAKVLDDLRKQREKYEGELKAGLERTQRALEKEKGEIEKSQEVLSRDALQRRVMEYQQKVANFQREVTEKAQALDAAFQKSLVQIQEKHLDPVVNGIISKKKLALVLDGRFVRISEMAAPALDITSEVVSALDRKITRVEMEKPKGM